MLETLYIKDKLQWVNPNDLSSKKESRKTTQYIPMDAYEAIVLY